MNKGQRRLIFISCLIIGGVLLIYSLKEAFFYADSPPLIYWSELLHYGRKAFLRYLVKQPTLYVGIAVIGLGAFIFKRGKP